MRTGLAFHHVVTDCGACTRQTATRSLKNALPPCTLYNSSKVTYKIIEISESEYSTHSQCTKVVFIDTYIQPGADSFDIVVQTVLHRNDAMDEASGYLATEVQGNSQPTGK